MKAERYFLYVGNAYPHKNLKRLIAAVISLNKNTSEHVELKIVSSRNVFTQKLQVEIDKMNASSLITLLGSVDDVALKDLYRNSLGFVFPSLSEGFGLPGIEAMRAGTLVLASDIPVFREIYEDRAIYFDPLSVSSIEAAMKKTLDIKSAERNEMLLNAKEFANRYSWVKMAKETLSVYEKALQKESSDSI